MERIFHPTSEMRCAHTRAFIEEIADVLNYLAARFEKQCPKLHARAVEAAESHNIPKDTPGYPHMPVFILLFTAAAWIFILATVINSVAGWSFST